MLTGCKGHPVSEKAMGMHEVAAPECEPGTQIMAHGMEANIASVKDDSTGALSMQVLPASPPPKKKHG